MLPSAQCALTASSVGCLKQLFDQMYLHVFSSYLTVVRVKACRFTMLLVIPVCRMRHMLLCLFLLQLQQYLNLLVSTARLHGQPNALTADVCNAHVGH